MVIPSSDISKPLFCLSTKTALNRLQLASLLFPLLQLRGGEKATAARIRLPAAISPALFLSGGQSGVGEGGRPGNRLADVYIGLGLCLGLGFAGGEVRLLLFVCG